MKDDNCVICGSSKVSHITLGSDCNDIYYKNKSKNVKKEESSEKQAIDQRVKKFNAREKRNDKESRQKEASREHETEEQREERISKNKARLDAEEKLEIAKLEREWGWKV